MAIAPQIRTLHPWPVRWWRSLRFAVDRLGHEHVVARAAPFRLRFTGPSNDCITRHIYRLGSHEPDMTQFLVDNIHIGYNEVAIDVGANLGWYSVLLDKLSASGARILAFEPDPSTFALLLKNLSANHASKVTPLNMALGDTPTYLRLHRYRDVNNGRHTLMKGGNTSGGTVPVKVNTLRDVWKACGLDERRIRFLKIDVEGFEYYVLRGAGVLLERCDCILMEYAPGYLKGANIDPRDMMSLLEKFQFRSHAFENGQLVERSFEQLADSEITLDLLLTASRP